MSSVPRAGIGRLNENALRDFPFVEDAPVALNNGYVLPQGLVLDVRVNSMLAAPRTHVFLVSVTLSGVSPSRTVTLTFSVGDDNVAFAVPENAAVPYVATYAGAAADATIVIGDGLAVLCAAVTNGAYACSVQVEPSCVTYQSDKQVRTLTGTYDSASVSGRVQAKDGYNAYIDVRDDGQTVVFGAFPGAGVGAQCGRLGNTTAELMLEYTGQPVAGETFEIRGTTYFWGPIEHPMRVYISGSMSEDDIYASVRSTLAAAITTDQSQAYAWGTVTLSATAVHDTGANSVTLDSPQAVIDIPGPTLPAAGDSFSVFGEVFEFGVDVPIGADAAETRDNVAVAVNARFTSLYVLTHTSGATSEEFSLADVVVLYTPGEPPERESVISFYGWALVIAPMLNEILIGDDAEMSYARMVAAVDTGYADMSLFHRTPIVYVTGDIEILLAANFSQVSNLISTLSWRAVQPWEERLVYVNGAKGDLYGNLRLQAGDSFAIKPDPDNHTVRVISMLNGDDLACKDC